MSKLTDKEIQLRAMREARFSSRGGNAVPIAETAPVRSQKASGKVGVASDPREGKFDRVAYQREYMKQWRAKKKALGRG